MFNFKIKKMKFIVYKYLFFIFLPFLIFAQNREIPIDTIVKTSHSTTIKGQTINCERNTSEIVDNLRTNPYSHPIGSIA